jgi:hypothetical protein
MMQLRAWMMLFLLPPALVLGSLAARKQRKTVMEKAKVSKQQAIAGALVSDAGKVVARQSAELDRALGQYIDQACAAQEAWLERAAEPKVAAAETAEQEKVRTLRLESRQVQEAQGELRMVRNQVAQTVVPELRRRLRDLSEAAGH